MAKGHSEKKNGKTYRRISVVVCGKSKRINIGYMSSRAFNQLLALVDQIESIKAVGGQLDQGLVDRLGKLDDGVVQKLIAVGLLKRKDEIPLFSAIAAEYVDHKLGMGEIKARTARVYRASHEIFTDEIGDLRIDAVTVDHVNEFKRKRLKDKNESTVGTDLKRIKGVFSFAVRKGAISSSPFANVKIPSQKLDSEKIEAQEQILDAQVLQDLIQFAGTRSIEWKVLVSIIRWTGCRLGEALILRWSDIQWDRNEIVMRSPKMEAHGKPTKVMPLWKPLEKDLLDLLDEVGGDSQYVLNKILNLENKPEFEITDDSGKVIREGRYETNAQTHFRRIMKKLGLDWPQPFHALRSFRRNELERAGYRQTDLNAWIGHDTGTANRHYGRSTPEDRRKAAEDPTGGAPLERADSGGEIVVSRFTQSDSDRPAKIGSSQDSTGKTRSEGIRASTKNGKVHPAGFEPATFGSVDRCSIQLS